MLSIAFTLYMWGIDSNPPGFYLDEASIAYNALSIANTGTDEHGVPWPLFFQTWDSSVAVNPVYVYALAAVFKVFGPSILAARLLSLIAGFVAAVGLGLVTTRTTGRRWHGVVIGGMAALTPWLFQVSRLVFEVALFPLVLAGLLLVLHRIHDKPAWSAGEVVATSILLGLLTYTYTTGRLLGPMLAAGLVIFASRSRIPSIGLTWVLFGLTLVPALAFNVVNAGALGARAALLGYIEPGMSIADIGARFLAQILANVDLGSMLLTGDPNIRHHVPVTGSVLAATLALAVVGLDHAFHRGWRNPWVRYLLFGLAAAVIPASLTVDKFHTLRLIAFPVFLLAIAGIGLGRLSKRRATALTLALVALAVVQGGLFQYGFHRLGPGRGAAFDAAFPAVFDAALRAGSRPIYLRDRGDLPGYIEAYWHGALRGVDRSSFVRLRPDEVPPPGAVVLGTDKTCGSCEVIADLGDYIAYRSGQYAAAGLIPNSGFEEIGSTPLGVFGSAPFGWGGGADVALFAGGATTEGAHLVLRHGSETSSVKQAGSALVRVPPAATLRLTAFVAAAPMEGSLPKLTIALVETDANRGFVTWHTVRPALNRGGAWQEVSIDTVAVDPRTAFVSVSIYLEPGGMIGDQVRVDDIVVDEVG